MKSVPFLKDRIIRSLAVISLALVTALPIGFSSTVGVSAQNLSILPVPNRPITRPAPSVRPAPQRPRPSMGRPGFTRPSPSFNRPPVGWTRPSPGFPPTPVRPRPTVKPPIGWTRPSPGSPGLPPLIVRPDPVKPPIVQPPIHRPPNHRPDHHFWGSWYWFDTFGWHHRVIYRGRTIVFVEGLPAGCRTRVRRQGRTYYKCNDVFYKVVTLRGERVYEVAIDQGSTARAVTRDLQLSSPFMRGSRVVALQKALKRRGYNVGKIDGIFGRGTARILQTFQQDVRLPATGIADVKTMRALNR